MDLKITKNDTIKLPLAKKYIEEDVNIITEIPLPSGTIDITENGEVDVTNYEKAKVDVPEVRFRQMILRTITEITAKDLEGLTKIGGYVFYGCSKLENVEIPDTITTIEGAAFQGTGITSLTLGSNITRLESMTFRNCTKLKYAKLDAVNYMNSYALGGCTALERLIFLSSTVPALNASALINLPTTCKIEVLPELVESYKSATNFSVYADQIIAYEGD